MADECDPAQAAPPDTNWADYHQHTLGRELPPPFVRGVQVLREAGVEPARAVEVGFGEGEETLVLLAAGWRVLAIDRANPGGHLVVNLFGTHDTWAGRPGMRFHERDQVSGWWRGSPPSSSRRPRKRGCRSWGPSAGTCST